MRPSRSESGQGPKLLTQLSRVLRARRYSPRTEEAYRRWVRRFVRFHELRHPDGMGAEEVNRFLTHLATTEEVSPSTQGQARAALLFLYREVLHRELDVGRHRIVTGKKPARVPTVLSREEVRRVLRRMRRAQKTVASLLYGSGLRLSEGISLRVKDLSLERLELRVRGGKGGRERVSMIPESLRTELEDRIAARRAQHDRDLASGCGWAVLPHSLDRKSPNAGFEFGWQFLFASSRTSPDPRTGAEGRYHLHPSSVQRAVREAARALALPKRVTCHTFRHSFATHLLEDGYDIRTIQELLGHKSVRTTMIYTHVLNRGVRGIRSPLDRIL